MSWNYRVVRHGEGDRLWYGLHEVYYNDDGSICCWAPKADVVGESLKELRDGLDFMLVAASRHSESARCAVPVLREEDMPGWTATPTGEAARAAARPGEA